MNDPRAMPPITKPLRYVLRRTLVLEYVVTDEKKQGENQWDDLRSLTRNEIIDMDSKTPLSDWVASTEYTVVEDYTTVLNHRVCLSPQLGLHAPDCPERD